MRRGVRSSFTAGPPRGAVGGDEVETVDRRLLERLDREFERAATRAGPLLTCRPGCSDCCHGPFPVTRLDARRLRRGLERIERRDPERCRAIRTRAGRAVEILQPDYPGDPATGRLRDDTRLFDAFLSRHGSLACPALDPETGRCDLYEWRPVTCRTYGPPLSFDGTCSAPCELCFRGADEETVEACRLRPDPDGIERSLLLALGVDADRPWETLIPFALEPDHA